MTQERLSQAAAVIDQTRRGHTVRKIKFGVTLYDDVFPTGHRRSVTVIEFPQIVSKGLVHERVDDRVGDVVGEVHVEDGHFVGDEHEGHEKGGQVRDDKHESHDEQDCGRLQVSNTVLLTRRQ